MTNDRPPVQALCCQCGNLATFPTTIARRGEPVWVTMTPGEGHGGQYGVLATESEGVGRCVIWRKCKVCKTDTVHAYLRGPDDTSRDHIEDVHRRRCLEHDPTCLYFCLFCEPGRRECAEMRHREQDRPR